MAGDENSISLISDVAVKDLTPTLANILHTLHIIQSIAMDQKTGLAALQFDLGGISMFATSAKSENGEYENLFHCFIFSGF